MPEGYSLEIMLAALYVSSLQEASTQNPYALAEQEAVPQSMS